MRFTETAIDGAFLVDLDTVSDDRGFFARAYSADEFEARGLMPRIAQVNVSHNRLKGTVRGLHYQVPPAVETKLMRCTAGGIYDVIVDLRPASPSYLTHVGVTLTGENRTALYVPGLVAHGYQTLEEQTEVTYPVGEFYTPGYERGLRWDDPAFGIEWPLPVAAISEKDRSWPDFEPGPPAP